MGWGFQGPLNPIPNGLFESKFQQGGGGGGGQFDPPFRSRLKEADCREILHGCQQTCKEYRYTKFSANNGNGNI